MNRLEQLPEITSDLLSGLKADDVLKHRILTAAVAADHTPRRALLRPLSALLCLSALVIALCIVIPRLSSPQTLTQGPGLHEIAAGSRLSASPVNLSDIISQNLHDDLFSTATPTITEEPAE